MTNEDFRFGSKWLSEFHMMMCAPEDEQELVTRTIDRGEITPNRSKPNHYSVSYDDTLLLHFFIMKKDGCHKQEDFRMSGDELHYIRSWLESPKKPTELVVPESEDEITTYYYGVFTSVQPYIVDGDCYGLKLEFTCDSPYGYSENHVLKYKVWHIPENLLFRFDIVGINGTPDGGLIVVNNDDGTFTITGENHADYDLIITRNTTTVLNAGRYMLYPGGDGDSNVRLAYHSTASWEPYQRYYNLIEITDDMEYQIFSFATKTNYHFDHEIITPAVYRYEEIPDGGVPVETLHIEDSFMNTSSEESEMLYPTIVITSKSTFGDDEAISFTNTSDDNKVMNIHIPSGISKLIIDCEKKVITDDQGNLVTMSDIGLVTPINGEYDLISTDIFSFNWFSFIYGSNDFAIDLTEGNSVDTIEIKTRFKIKSGGF